MHLEGLDSEMALVCNNLVDRYSDIVFSYSSAPTSPAKSSYGGSGGGVGSVIGSVSSGGGGGAAAMVQGITRNILQAASQKTSSVLASASSSRDRCKCLLVIDNQPVDW